MMGLLTGIHSFTHDQAVRVCSRVQFKPPFLPAESLIFLCIVMLYVNSITGMHSTHFKTAKKNQ